MRVERAGAKERYSNREDYGNPYMYVHHYLANGRCKVDVLVN
eukprot:COSAG02_NODE_67598_length_252_cov_1.104575_1_plen_41_part_01